MKKIKIFMSLILCIVLCAAMSFSVFAAPVPNIKISNEAAMAGQEVTVDITISGNPGIMAMTFSITYDKAQFEFINVANGFISTPTYKDHSDKGYVAFSISETSDKTTSGNIMSIKFKIKDTAKPGKYAINLCNPDYEKYGSKIDNCFSNSKEELIVPKITIGSITVETECDRTGHNFGGWAVTKEPSCTETGLKTRTCSRCGGVEEISLTIKHDLEDDWTVDKAATPQENGTMSRHCKLCGAHLEEITFTYEEVGGNDTESSNPENNSSSNNSSSTNDNSQPDNSETESSDSQTDSSTDDNSQPTQSTPDTSSDNTIDTPNKKPTINNTVGSKNPLSAVEGLKDYQDKFVQNEPEEPTESEIFINPEQQEGINDIDSDNQSKKEIKPSTFFTSTAGIVLLVICILLSLGILVLGVILIIKNNKKSQQ